jgi:hypothetical protein
MSIRNFVWTSTAAVSATLAPATLPATAQQQQQPPNILVIMGADVGWLNIGA